jgi:hypothetical protein
MTKPKNYPIAECSEVAEKLIENGCKVFQKFTCSGCGKRLTIDEPNIFYTSAKCDECPAITDIAKDGCNYLVVSGSSLASVAAVMKHLGGK